MAQRERQTQNKGTTTIFDNKKNTLPHSLNSNNNKIATAANQDLLDLNYNISPYAIRNQTGYNIEVYEHALEMSEKQFNQHSQQ